MKRMFLLVIVCIALLVMAGCQTEKVQPLILLQDGIPLYTFVRGDMADRDTINAVTFV